MRGNASRGHIEGRCQPAQPQANTWNGCLLISAQVFLNCGDQNFYCDSKSFAPTNIDMVKTVVHSTESILIFPLPFPVLVTAVIASRIFMGLVFV
jgi:hypothetical protein